MKQLTISFLFLFLMIFFCFCSKNANIQKSDHQGAHVCRPHNIKFQIKVEVTLFFKLEYFNRFALTEIMLQYYSNTPTKRN